MGPGCKAHELLGHCDLAFSKTQCDVSVCGLVKVISIITTDDREVASMHCIIEDKHFQVSTTHADNDNYRVELSWLLVSDSFPFGTSIAPDSLMYESSTSTLCIMDFIMLTRCAEWGTQVLT